jgi:hypothetical protein
MLPLSNLNSGAAESGDSSTETVIAFLARNPERNQARKRVKFHAPFRQWKGAGSALMGSSLSRLTWAHTGTDHRRVTQKNRAPSADSSPNGESAPDKDRAGVGP